MNARQICTRNCQRPRLASRRQKQGVVREHGAIVETDTSRITRDFLYPATEASFYGVFGVEMLRAQDQAVFVQRAGEELLRQRWTLIRQVWLIAHDRQLPREAFAA